MLKLMLLCLGTTVLLHLSERYDPMRYGGWSEHRQYMRRPMDVCMLIVVIWMTCFSFLRTSYNDTGNYIRAFTSAQSISQGIDAGIYFDWIENPLSSLYRDWIHSWTDNYHIYFFFPAWLLSIAVVKICKHYSVSPAMSLFLFFCLVFGCMKFS